MNINERQLENFIIDSGIVSKEGMQELKKVAEEKKLTIGQVAVQKGVLSDDDVRRIQAYMLGVPFVDLKNRKIDFATLSLIPEPISRAHNVVSFRKNAETLEVAMLSVDDLASVDFLKKSGGLKIQPRLTDSESMKWALLSYQKMLRLSFGDIIQKNSENTNLVVDILLKHALLQGASDIHIEPEEGQVLVRYRIGGLLHDAMVLPKSAAPAIVSRLKELSGLKLDEKHLPQDGRFRLEADGERVSFRVSTLPIHSGEKVAIRILRENVSGFTLGSLGFHGEGLEDLHQALKPAAMVLVTGPADSGLTTTLYTMLDLLNQPHLNISTIEDPVEHQMPRINQMQVRPEIGLSFASGLRTLLRQDSDVMMVGEIRDAETAGLVTKASFTGCLVLSALHSATSAGAISRLLDMKVSTLHLVSTLRVVVAQRLVRKLADNKEKYFLNTEELNNLGNLVSLPRVLELLKKEGVVGRDATWDKIPFYKPVSGNSSDDGYAGRIGIQEVLVVTPSVKELIMKGAASVEIESEAKKGGMTTLVEDGLFKAAQGLTTIEEVLRVAIK